MRLFALLVTTVALLLASPSLTVAASTVPDPGGPTRADASTSQDEIRFGLSREARPGQSSRASGNAPAEVTYARHVYACAGNTYAVDPSVNEACEESIQACADGDLTTRQFIRFAATVADGSGPPPPGPPWTIAGYVCITPAEATEAEITVTLADFRRLPLPAAEPGIQPAGGQALIRARTNVYVDPASTEPQLFDLTLLATPVQVRATPVEFTWDFGDGSQPLSTVDPGAPYPDLTTWHEYESPGTVQIGLTTTYTGEYSVAGGPWQTIPGSAEVGSTPQPLQLLSTTNRLTG